MKKNWTLTLELFNSLLDWLDTDREKAGFKYQQIREKLVKLFASRGFHNAEDLADETINRASAKSETLAATYTGDKSLFFYGIAKNIIFEANRNREVTINEHTTESGGNSETSKPNGSLDCLNECLAHFTDDQQETILTYYETDQNKSLVRNALAERLGMSVSTLRVYVYRLREKLKDCIEKCVE